MNMVDLFTMNPPFTEASSFARTKKLLCKSEQFGLSPPRIIQLLTEVDGSCLYFKWLFR
jgi:hypothetical protein